MDAFLSWVLEHWNEITVALLLFAILIGGSKPKPWWVFGWLFQERTKERDEWKKLALRAMNTARKGVSKAEEAIDDDA